MSPFRLSPCLLRVVGPPGAREYSLLQSPFFKQYSSSSSCRLSRASAATAGTTTAAAASAAVPVHAWASGALGLFEHRLAAALECLRNQRDFLHAAVELFVRDPAALYRTVRITHTAATAAAVVVVAAATEFVKESYK